LGFRWNPQSKRWTAKYSTVLVGKVAWLQVGTIAIDFSPEVVREVDL